MLKTILDTKETFAKEILKDVDPDYLNKDQVYIDKSLRDVRYTILFTIEGLKLGNKRIIEAYLKWLIETLSYVNISSDPVDLMLKAMQRRFAPYLTLEQTELLASVNLHEIHKQNQQELDNPYEDEKNAYLDCLLKRNRLDAKTLVDTLLESGIEIKDIYVHILQASMYEIGTLWQSGRITVADEHLATVITQYIMTTLYPIVFSTPKHGKKLLSSAIGTELHEIGIRMVTDCYEISGFETQYLGSNIPPEEFVKYAKEFKPDLIALSVTLPLHLTSLKETIELIKSTDALINTKIIVGGQAFHGNEEIFHSLGADAFAKNALDAIKEGEALVK